MVKRHREVRFTLLLRRLLDPSLTLRVTIRNGQHMPCYAEEFLDVSLVPKLQFGNTYLQSSTFPSFPNPSLGTHICKALLCNMLEKTEGVNSNYRSMVRSWSFGVRTCLKIPNSPFSEVTIRVRCVPESSLYETFLPDQVVDRYVHQNSLFAPEADLQVIVPVDIHRNRPERN